MRPPFFVPPAGACYNTTAKEAEELMPQTDLIALSAIITDAALAIAAEHKLDQVLQKSVDLACELAGARYAALGLSGPDGRLAQFVVSGMSDQEIAQIKSKPAGRGILGLLLTKPQTLRLPDLNQHTSSFGFPPHHPPMSSFLGIPVTIQGKLLGSLYLADKIGED